MNLEELLRLTAECPNMRIVIKQGKLYMESGETTKEIKVEGICGPRNWNPPKQ